VIEVFSGNNGNATVFLGETTMGQGETWSVDPSPAPASGSDVTYYVTYYHPDGEAAESLELALEGSCEAMDLEVGAEDLGVWSATTGAPGEDGFGTLAQGFLEMSNVSVVDEMVNMITAQRAYEINSKAIQAADDMLQTANNLKR
jgi:flagellar basal body rod protein FlgG